MAEKLTGLQWAFVVAYTGEARFNGTDAARIAGYKGNDNVLAVTASNNLRIPKIRAAIDARMKSLIMSADEAMLRLTEEASSSIADFIGLNEDGKSIFWDFKKAEALGKLHLIKKVKWGKYGPEIELYDRQAAEMFIVKQERGDKLSLALDEETARLAEKLGVSVDSIVEKLAAMIRKKAEAEGIA